MAIGSLWKNERKLKFERKPLNVSCNGSKPQVMEKIMGDKIGNTLNTLGGKNRKGFKALFVNKEDNNAALLKPMQFTERPILKSEGNLTNSIINGKK